MIKPQTYCHLPLADLKSQNFFQSRVNSGKMNEEFYKPIIETVIKEQLKNNSNFNLFDFENDNLKLN